MVCFDSIKNSHLSINIPQIAKIVDIEYLEHNQIAYDIKGHLSSQISNIRIWCGPTIDTNDLKYLMN